MRIISDTLIGKKRHIFLARGTLSSKANLALTAITTYAKFEQTQTEGDYTQAEGNLRMRKIAQYNVFLTIGREICSVLAPMKNSSCSGAEPLIYKAAGMPQIAQNHFGRDVCFFLLFMTTSMGICWRRDFNTNNYFMSCIDLCNIIFSLIYDRFRWSAILIWPGNLCERICSYSLYLAKKVSFDTKKDPNIDYNTL